MYNYPIAQADPLVNAFLQTLLLVLCPLAFAFLAGGATALGLFFRRYPLFAHNKQSSLSRSHSSRHACAYLCLGLSPLAYLVLNRFLAVPLGTSLVLVLAVCASSYLGAMLYRKLGKVDRSLLETALSCGLNNSQIIQFVIWPAGKAGLYHALCQTALFLLAMASLAGCLAGGGLMGFAIQSTGLPQPSFPFFLSFLLLTLLFLLPIWLSARLTARHSK